MISMGMLAPRKFLQRRKKIEVFKDSADQKNWRRLMKEIDETGSAVSVLTSEKTRNKTIPRDLVLGTLIRYKQLKRWNLVIEVIFDFLSLEFKEAIKLEFADFFCLQFGIFFLFSMSSDFTSCMVLWHGTSGDLVDIWF